MKYDISLLDGLPDVMSLEDVRVFCHISKRTARYYLQNGLIPCRNNGKKTHCYSVTREQLADALGRFEACPDKFAVPKTVTAGDKTKAGRIAALVMLNDRDVRSDATKKYYRRLLADRPDVLGTSDVSSVTGYCTTAVNEWCNKGLLPYVDIHGKRMIAKTNLFKYVLSKDYNNITRKSKKHLCAIRTIHESIGSEAAWNEA